jgi:hypothetical protein
MKIRIILLLTSLSLITHCGGIGDTPTGMMLAAGGGNNVESSAKVNAPNVQPPYETVAPGASLETAPFSSGFNLENQIAATLDASHVQTVLPNLTNSVSSLALVPETPVVSSSPSSAPSQSLSESGSAIAQTSATPPTQESAQAPTTASTATSTATATTMASTATATSAPAVVASGPENLVLKYSSILPTPSITEEEYIDSTSSAVLTTSEPSVTNSIDNCTAIQNPEMDTLGNPNWTRLTATSKFFQNPNINEPIIAKVNLGNNCREGFYRLGITVKVSREVAETEKFNIELQHTYNSVVAKSVLVIDAFSLNSTTEKSKSFIVYLKKGNNDLTLTSKRQVKDKSGQNFNLKMQSEYVYRGELVTDGGHIPCPSFKAQIDPSQGRWFLSTEPGSIAKSGIETYWARETLKLRITDNCKAGYYLVTVEAKNSKGNLPSSYTHFRMNVENESLALSQEGRKTIGFMKIAASTEEKRQASTRIWLKEGENILDLKWLNDYYVAGEYDANINITKVVVDYVTDAYTQNPLIRTGIQFCDAAPNGSDYKWYWIDNSAYTYWANQYIDYCFQNLTPGRYKVFITAKNLFTGTELPLPPTSSYPKFRVKVAAGSNNSIAEIDASQTEYKTGYTFVTVPNGVTSIRLTWLNDSYLAGQHDANIQINRLELAPAN